jgi:cytochrome oxidase Cu insertion factor (SCO1/SenC/PrrC family)
MRMGRPLPRTLRHRAAAAAIIAAALGVGIWIGHQQPASSALTPPALSALTTNPDLDPGTPLGGRRAPNFRLVNQFGQPVSLSQWRGKVVLLAFVDDECTTICPLTTQSMLQAVRLLGPAASGVQLLGVVANPEALQVKNLRAFSQVHGLMNSWQFLTGTPAAVRRVWKEYGIYVAVVNGTIDHTPALFLINRQGREEDVYDTQMAYAAIPQQAQVLARAMARWLPGHPVVPQKLSYTFVSGISPKTPVSLPTETARGSGPPVTLGPGRAHLVVFFASWLRQTMNLSANLTALNAYVAAAAAHGWPLLTAVDESPTEPSPSTLRTYLKALPGQIAFPVALDETGRLADGYGVQNQPWLVITSASGRIVWHHDGFLPLAQLEAVAARYGSAP